MSERTRRRGPIKSELLKKSREAALAAVQIFNNPNITFKAESYVVLMIIAWTYLLHAHFRDQKIDYRYCKQSGKRRIFVKTKHGAYKFWGLEDCLNNKSSPIDKDTANNLRLLFGLRHEIEHQMTTRIDDTLNAYFQACCLNYNKYITKLFGNANGIEKYLSFSLQFSTISTEQKELLEKHTELPANIYGYIQQFSAGLSHKELVSPHYVYRLMFVPQTANRKGQADRVIEFVDGNAPGAEEIKREYTVIQDREKKKFLPGQVVEMIKKEGYPKFSLHHHTQLWKSKDAKNSNNGYGVMVAEKTWHWYERWIEVVLKHCKDSGGKYL